MKKKDTENVSHEVPEDIQFPQGIKWTKQRKNVYRVLWDSSEPLSAVQIFRLVMSRTQGGDYALSTVYRILAAFDAVGLTEKTTLMEDGTAVYALKRGEHTHYAVCLGCHRRIPLSRCPFADMSIGNDCEGFVVTGHKLEVYGYCSECNKDKKERDSL